MQYRVASSSLALMLLMVSPALCAWDLSKMISYEHERPVYHGVPVEDELINAWPEDLEAEFQQRARDILRHQTEATPPGVNTYFENEKRTYGYLMAHVLAGDRPAALEKLQARDHQHEQWHRETMGIDYYACFTLKHQIRKYFYFGDLLDPEYKKQMFDGAKQWTRKDPMRRPHYAFKSGTTGWGPDAKNSWVDVRSTENLYLMRVTSVYLMAEETENEETAEKYKQEILDYTKTPYRVGIGEWDSENYHGHSIAPLLNLYDFAKDREVKRAAKACLDFYTAAGAVKYWRGGFNGPTKRDYNHAQPMGGSAANILWVWFGDSPVGKTTHWESDEVHQITSRYRPPVSVVNLARKKFKRPVELFAAKPSYSATTSHLFDSLPEFSETQHIANTYQMGSLTGGTSEDGGDVNGFKVLVWSKQKGAEALHAVPGSNPNYPGSPMYQKGMVSGPNRVAQQENIALWLVKNGQSPWIWVIPQHVQVKTEEDVTFLICERTWIAIRALGATRFAVAKDLTQQLAKEKKSRFPEHQVLQARGVSKNFCGLAIEVGEAVSHGTYKKFQEAVLAADIDVSQLEKGIAQYRAADGKWLGIHYNDDPMDLGVWRNGTRRELKKTPLYESAVVSAKWGDGTLRVQAGGDSFQCTVEANGHVVFE